MGKKCVLFCCGMHFLIGHILTRKPNPPLSALPPSAHSLSTPLCRIYPCLVPILLYIYYINMITIDLFWPLTDNFVTKKKHLRAYMFNKNWCKILAVRHFINISFPKWQSGLTLRKDLHNELLGRKRSAVTPREGQVLRISGSSDPWYQQ